MDDNEQTSQQYIDGVLDPFNGYQNPVISEPTPFSIMGNLALDKIPN
ncbi:10534_t:CDS:2 [Scutellospora calospora]|uniref:10534_t:CDS:1 n=1 Tax=Scutellospora calospora TaxID=85575 RepID=A0ACA9K312_9GLOM|nr:10534_t:CDS:2 [Scutellospora calospora]